MPRRSLVVSKAEPCSLAIVSSSGKWGSLSRFFCLIVRVRSTRSTTCRGKHLWWTDEQAKRGKGLGCCHCTSKDKSYRAPRATRRVTRLSMPAKATRVASFLTLVLLSFPFASSLKKATSVDLVDYSEVHMKSRICQDERYLRIVNPLTAKAYYLENTKGITYLTVSRAICNASCANRMEYLCALMYYTRCNINREYRTCVLELRGRSRHQLPKGIFLNEFEPLPGVDFWLGLHGEN